MQLAVYHDKLFVSPWQSPDSVTVALKGINLDAVWQNIVSTIGSFEVSQENTLTEQIHADEERNKLLRQIEALERKMLSTAQPRRKREIFLEVQRLKSMIL